MRLILSSFSAMTNRLSFQGRFPFNFPILLIVFLSAFGIQGCAFTPQTVNLNPGVPMGSSNVGSGKTVQLMVVDERTETGLGHRGSAYGDAAEISTGQIISELIYNKVSQSLSAKGFQVERGNIQEDRKLRVEIREIKYHSAAGLLTFTLKANSAIKGICKNGNHAYDRLYRGEVREESMVVPFAETNEKMINQTLSKVLGDMLLDQELMSCLAA